MPEDSSRTRMIKEIPEAEMGPVKRFVKKGMEKGSEFLDRLGLTQEKEFEGKTKEELAVKKRAGGSVYSIDGIAKRGKTRAKQK